MKILGLSGSLQSGKTSTANFIVGCKLVQIGLTEYFKLDDDGDIVVPTINDEGLQEERNFTLENKDPRFVEFANREIWPHVKTYSFADPLKMFCINVFGLTYEQCYGTDIDKNSPTSINWRSMPGKSNHKSQIMTAREVLQFFGTEIVRKIKDDAWVHACITQITNEQSDFAIVSDCRFPNEVDAIKQAGGKVIRLTRQISENLHDSEKILSKENYDWNNFDYVIDNQNMTLSEKNCEVYKALRTWGWIEEINDSNLPS